MYPSTKEQPANQEMNGKQSSKVAPMFASAMQPWQDNLGARTLFVLHQDVAVMFVNMVPIKLKQLLKGSAIEGEPQVNNTGPGARESCLSLLQRRYKEQLHTQ